MNLRLSRFLTAVLLVLALAIPVAVFAQEVPPPDPGVDFMVLLKMLVGAFQGGQWPLVTVLLFIGVTQILRWGGSKWIPWLATSDGGTVLTFLTVTASALAAGAFVPGVVITWAFLGKAVFAAFSVIGGWTGTRRFLGVLAPLAAKIPSVGPTIAGILIWLSGNAVAAQVEVKASGAYVPVPTGMTPQQAAALLARPPVV